MVRFARAHGSKGSNERVPEEATPWHELKEQLLSVSSTTDDQDSASQPIERKPFVFQKTSDNAPIKWAEFEPNVEARGTAKIRGAEKMEVETVTLVESVPKKRKKKKSKECDEKDVTHKISSKSRAVRKEKPTTIERLCKNVMKKCAIDPSLVTSEKTKKEEVKSLKRQRRAEKRELNEVAASDGAQEEKTELAKAKKLLRRKLQRQKKAEALTDKMSTTANDSISGEKSAANPIKLEVLLSKRQKRNLKNRLANKAKGAQQTATLKNSEGNPSGATSTSKNVSTKASKRKNDLGSSDSLQSKRPKRRKPEPAITVMQFNGKDVEVVHYDGFPIRKQDADHLTELRKQMVENLIPEKEINHTMKLERRKAEKALARERKKVCFHCRKSGHNLSECPELGDAANHEAPGSGICYKCGSTEHTHFECRVNRGNEYSFAKCFICKEQGHISKQCPDNPRGLYPKGGGCKVCGDVTHLKKDCPDLRSKKEENIITLNTVQGNGLELLDEDMKVEERQPVVHAAPKAKIVKF